MSCSESAAAANSFLVDSLISGGRGEQGPYYQGSGVYLPQTSEVSYGLQSCGLFPVLSKRNEAAPQNHTAPTSQSYAPAMEVWLDNSRSCRVDPAESQTENSCSFSQNIKEESSYCLFNPSALQGPLHAKEIMQENSCICTHILCVGEYLELSRLRGQKPSK
uniref:Uncharacterized protein n=1 Tax=Leptobrachium leishanense TaxID=445787 RepID=A0A8C5MLA9_9ANUR